MRDAMRKGFNWRMPVVAAMAGWLVACGGGGSGEQAAEDTQSGCTGPADCPGGYCNTASGECLACEPNTAACVNGGVAVCSASGEGYGAPAICDDGDPCTDDPACEAGACPSPVPKSCDDSDPCTSDICRSTDGMCLHRPNGSSGCCQSDADCSDGLACTQDRCLEGGACENAGGPCLTAGASFGSKGSGPGQLSGPRGIAVHSDGRIFVADSGNNRIAVFAADGTWLSAFAEGELASPAGMAWLSSGLLAIADTGNGRVALFTADGQPSGSWDGAGSADALVSPSDVAPTPDGGVWVANTGKENVVRFTSDGAIAQTLGQKGDSIGNFRIPRGIWLSPGGLLWVSDSEQQRITVYDAEAAQVVATVGTSGAGEGQFSFAAGLRGLPGGAVALADPGNKRLQFASFCQPSCPEGAECGGDGCGGSCGTCSGQDASCEDAKCTGPILGGAGCIAATEEIPTCGGCACEECACGADDFCCETAWDEICVQICADPCGAVCALVTPPAGLTVNVTRTWPVGSSPTQLAVGPDGTLWVVDNIEAKVFGLQVEE